ncbi:MAG: entericidin A/B family lipoprotein [Hydrogenophaga sp.]|jgi:predicted small secreted protein|nr:entericidin A/B family lipoprotein [Hydrogenophaga intermedia]MCM3564461.1 entericidin A/B family lipoprotein [Hydrogenophaga intermedia]
MKKFASLIAIGLALLAAGCNTFQGIGQDIQKGGQVIEDAAKKK